MESPHAVRGFTRLAIDRPAVLAALAPSPHAIGCALAVLSFGATLFALAIFKLLSFFVMPSLFFDLLFIGFPVGAWLGTRWGRADARRFAQCLVVLQVLMLASVASGLLAKRFDYLRAHLFDVDLTQLVVQLGAFIGLFLPYFVAYGMAEYVGYQTGRRHLGGRTSRAYALALFGAAAAYGALRLWLPWLGMARVLLLAFAAVVFAGVLATRGGARRLAIGELLVVVGLSAFDVDGPFLALYKGRGMQSTHEYERDRGCRRVFQRWGRYALTEILASRSGREYYGFYNDMFQWEYSPEYGFAHASLGVVPLRATPADARIAIVGAGGGRQVRFAQQLGGRRQIVAIELEPAVHEAVRRPEHLRARFRHVYEHPRVTPIRGEARRFLLDNPDPFDLIYLPSVGGYAQMMIEPGNMVRTFEAHRLMRDRLTARGMLALWYPMGLDSTGVLTTQYVQTLRALGMPAAAYKNAAEWLVLAYKDAAAAPPDIDALKALVGGRIEGPAAEAFEPEPFPVADDPQFRPITDEKPFLAGNVRHILSISQVLTLLGISLGVIAGFGLLTLLGLGVRWNRAQYDGQAFPRVAAQAVLIGANFLMLEHLLVMSLFRRVFVFDDALGLGAVAFLSLTALGSVLPPIPTLARLPLAALSLAGLVTLSLLPGAFRTEAILTLVLPAALLTGQFFPALFDRCARNPLPVFALDAVGAGLGALFATFIPILWGFQAFFLLTALVFVATACGHARSLLVVSG